MAFATIVGATPDRIAGTTEGRDAVMLAARPPPTPGPRATSWPTGAPRLVAMLVRDRPPLTAFDERRWAEVAGYADADFHHLLRTFAARRAELVAMLRRLGPGDWQRQGLHEQHGPITLRQTLGHLVEHCAQIEALLA